MLNRGIQSVTASSVRLRGSSDLNFTCAQYIPRLEAYRRSAPLLLERRFTLREIYPLECGCSDQGGMHWTPIGGTTLLHLAVDFSEPEVFDCGRAPDAGALVVGGKFERLFVLNLLAG